MKGIDPGLPFDPRRNLCRCHAVLTFGFGAYAYSPEIWPGTLWEHHPRPSQIGLAAIRAHLKI